MSAVLRQRHVVRDETPDAVPSPHVALKTHSDASIDTRPPLPPGNGFNPLSDIATWLIAVLCAVSQYATYELMLGVGVSESMSRTYMSCLTGLLHSFFVLPLAIRTLYFTGWLYLLL